ncbi:hypothetical protein DZ11F48_43350 [Escherichia coli]
MPAKTFQDLGTMTEATKTHNINKRVKIPEAELGVLAIPIA